MSFAVSHEHADPNEAPCAAWPAVEPRKEKARDKELGNLFLPDLAHGAALPGLASAPRCERLGRSVIGPGIFPCSAPDAGNRARIARYEGVARKNRSLEPREP